MPGKIAVILGRLVIGGAILDTLQVLAYLQYDFEIMLITGNSQKDEYEAGYLTEKLPKVVLKKVNGFSGNINPVRDWRAYLEIKAILKDFKPHIVHTHTPKAGLIGRLAAFSAKVPVVVHTYHGMIFQGYYGPTLSKMVVKLERWLTKKTTAVVALSEKQLHQLTSSYKITQPQKVTVIPLGIETNDFQADNEEKRKRFREKYLVKDDEVAVGIIGRIVPIKNHHFFLQVVKELSKKQLPVRFFIIGDGVLRSSLEQECEIAGIDYTFFPQHPRLAHLTFTSWIVDASKAICGLDIVALTSISEGTPVSLLEAQAAGRPVVTTRAGAVENIVQNGRTGYIVEQSDVGNFASYLEKLITQPDLLNQMGKMGITFIKENFEKERQVKDFKNLYQNLLAH